MIRLEDKGRRYKRFRPSAQEKVILASEGFQWVLSSNVSGLKTQGEDLIIRFINGSIYEYKNVAYMYENMLESNSKGHFVWVNLRRKKVPYRKIGRLKLELDFDLTDEELFTKIDTQGIEFEEYLKKLGLFIPMDNMSPSFLTDIKNMLGIK